MLITMGTLIGITQGKLMGDIGDLHEFYNWYTGTSVYAHQLPRLYEQTHVTIMAQHPFICNMDLSNVNKDNWKAVLSNLIEEHGNSFQVARPLFDKHLIQNPLTKLADAVGSERIIVVEH